MECIKMDYNQELLKMPTINYDPGKIDGFNFRSQLKQKGYLGYSNAIPNSTFTPPLPQRKKRVLKIINPETGNEIFEDLKKKAENAQKTSQAGEEESRKDKQQDTTSDNKSPSLENINNNRVTLQSSVHNDNNFITAKSSSYVKFTDTYTLNVFSQKFTSSYNGMLYNQPFYPLSDHLLSYQNIPSSNYHQQPYLYPYRNLPYYNSDVCYYPPINAQNNNGLLKNDHDSALPTVNQSSEESLADLKNDNKTLPSQAPEECKEKNEKEEKEKMEQNDKKGTAKIKEEKQEKKDTTSEKTNEEEEKEEATPSGSKNLDPNAKSFIFNGVLPNINFIPDFNSIRRYSNTGYNVDFVENERWMPKVSDKSRLVMGGVTSTPRLMRSDSEGDGLDKVVGKEEGGPNKSGRIQYSREFLLNLQYEPDSLKIPKDPIIYPEIIQTGLHPHHMRIRMKKQQQCMDYNHSHFQHNNNVLEQSNNNNTLKNSSISMPSVIDKNTPSQIKNIFNNSLQQQTGRHIKGKSLQQQQVMTPKKIIQVPIEKNVKLHHANNAWRPKTASTSETIQPDENAIMDLYKKVRGILNKLTPQKFDTLIQQVHDLSINTEEKLKGCIKLIFEKAIGEPSFSLAYAKMAKSLNNLKVHMDGQPEETVTFRKLLLNQCQKEFEKDKAHQQDLEKLTLLIEKASSEKDKQRLLETKEQAEKMAKRRSLGNIRFIGELFRLKMLTENIMFECISRLLRFSADEDNVECLCRLLTTIGRDLEIASPACKQRLDGVFEDVTKLANKKELSSRMRFMLQDVMELRLNSWVPRRDDNQPKTIEQIHREAELEHKSLVGEKRSINNLQRGSFSTQKKFVFDQHRLDIRPNGVKGRGKDEKAGVPRAVVGCGVRSLLDPIKNTTFKTRNSVPEISSDLKMKEVTLQAKNQISKDIKALSMSNSADSLMHRTVHCEEKAVTTGV